MNLRPRDREEPDINLTPLIDVVFLLLIFFMVSTTFLKEADLEVTLPEASAEPKPQERQRLEVVVDARGRYSVNGRPLEDTGRATLRRVLIAYAGDQRDLPFVIRADARTPHQSVVTVMDLAARLGFKQVGIVTAAMPEP